MKSGKCQKCCEANVAEAPVVEEAKVTEAGVEASGMDSVTVTKDGEGLKVTAQVSGAEVQAPVLPEAPATHEVADDDKEVLNKDEESSEQHFEALKHDYRKLRAQHAITLAERNKAVEVLESNDSLKALQETFQGDIVALTERFEAVKAELKHAVVQSNEGTRQVNTLRNRLTEAQAVGKRDLVSKYAQTIVETTGLKDKLSESQIKVITTAKTEQEADKLISEARATLREARLTEASTKGGIVIKAESIEESAHDTSSVAKIMSSFR